MHLLSAVVFELCWSFESVCGSVASFVSGCFLSLCSYLASLCGCFISVSFVLWHLFVVCSEPLCSCFASCGSFASLCGCFKSLVVLLFLWVDLHLWYFLSVCFLSLFYGCFVSVVLCASLRLFYISFGSHCGCFMSFCGCFMSPCDCFVSLFSFGMFLWLFGFSL